MRLLAWSAAAFGGLMVVITLAFTAAVGDGGSALAAGPTTVNGIPPEYLQLYVRAGERYKVDWAILAALGWRETNHGRLQGGRCATSSAGARGPMQFMPGTWAIYGKGGDVCDPRDAIPAAARLLLASGAPGDYHRAIFAYNHAEWYVAQVLNKAEEYRAMAVGSPSAGQQQAGAISGQWLVPIPGTSEQCDARIVANVIALLRRWHATLRACYAATGHEPSGEHPLGLAVDLAPTPPGSWSTMAALARWAGWREACASSGCASQTHTAFRFVGWNGFPGHGDPAHAGTNAHLHLSWDHGPGKPAAWVHLAAGI